MEAKTIIEEKHTFEVVEVPLTIKLPKPFMEFLNKLAAMLDMTVEAILKDEIYGHLRDFCQNGFLEGWMDIIFESYVNGAKGKQLEAMIEKIDC